MLSKTTIVSCTIIALGAVFWCNRRRLNNQKRNVQRLKSKLKQMMCVDRRSANNGAVVVYVVESLQDYTLV